MNFELCLEEFNNYAKRFDLNIKEIKYKFDHSLRVVDYVNMICEAENFLEEETSITLIAALLHDIARFQEWTIYNSWSKIDHGDLGCEILLKDNFISRFVSKNKENLILNVVKYHNKLEIPEFLDEDTKKILKVVRDADKIDILMTQCLEENFENKIQNISAEILDSFLNEKMLQYSQIENKNNLILNHLSYIFDINYRTSFKIIYHLRIMNKKLEILKNLLGDKKQYKVIDIKINDYIESNIKL